MENLWMFVITVLALVLAFCLGAKIEEIFIRAKLEECSRTSPTPESMLSMMSTDVLYEKYVIIEKHRFAIDADNYSRIRREYLESKEEISRLEGVIDDLSSSKKEAQG